MIRVEYIFNGKKEFSLYSAEWYSIQEARIDVLRLFPLAYITASYISQIKFK